MKDPAYWEQPFDFEPFLAETLRIKPAAGPSCGTVAVEASDAAGPENMPGALDLTRVCLHSLRGQCPRSAAQCGNRHLSNIEINQLRIKPQRVKGDGTVVCKHWLKGLCKKDDICNFLHAYDLRRQPECNTFSKDGFCNSLRDCSFRHTDPVDRVPECPRYNRGFCPLGPECEYLHIRRVACEKYMAGFCPDGPTCRFAHPRWELALPQMTPPYNHLVIEKPELAVTRSTAPAASRALPPVVPVHMSQAAREAAAAANISNVQPQVKPQVKPMPQPHPQQQQQQYQQYQQQQQQQQGHQMGQGNQGQQNKQRPLETVLCFKCNEYGHYANHCPQRGRRM
ncbi:hypothetical protein GQ42DRAFT_165567, partial [Ramicandelaber brevisporus]